MKRNPVAVEANPSERQATLKLQMSEIRWYEERMFCECEGEMKPTGTCLTCLPPLYPHQCDICNQIENFKVTYPNLTYEIVKRI